MFGGEQIALRDGRRLGVTEFGVPDGRPVLYCHGFPASRLEARLVHEAAMRQGVRLVAIDRPGYGLSDFNPGRRILDWPQDVIEVFDRPALQRFAVLGVSGGAPYALACAVAIPERVTAVGIACGLGTTTIAEDLAYMNAFARFSLAFARATPRLSRLVYSRVGLLLKERPQWVLALLAARMPPADHATLADPGVYAALAASLREAFRQGGEGAAYELTLYAQPWNFSAAGVQMPVYLWHGEQDTTVPVAMGRRMAAFLPGCRAKFYADEGHFSLPVRRMDDIFACLLQHA
jgi:pimeloyl-ACP methyl ester carboxylesterase